MEIIEIVDKLVGDTQPTWYSERDLEALNALETKIGLVEHLIKEIKNASKYRNEQAHSVSRIGVVADKFIKNLKNDSNGETCNKKV